MSRPPNRPSQSLKEWTTSLLHWRWWVQRCRSQPQERTVATMVSHSPTLFMVAKTNLAVVVAFRGARPPRGTCRRSRPANTTTLPVLGRSSLGEGSANQSKRSCETDHLLHESFRRGAHSPHPLLIVEVRFFIHDHMALVRARERERSDASGKASGLRCRSL